MINKIIRWLARDIILEKNLEIAKREIYYDNAINCIYELCCNPQSAKSKRLRELYQHSRSKEKCFMFGKRFTGGIFYYVDDKSF